MSEYVKQAKNFLKETNTKMKIIFVDTVTSKEIGFSNSSSNWYHNKYKVTLSRNNKSYSFPFYDSYANYCNGKRPTAYDILACLEKYEVNDDLYSFAKEYGYNLDTIEEYNRVQKIHKSCINQYNKLLRLFDNNDDIMDKLSEIY